MVQYPIASHSFRMWSSRSVEKPVSVGVAMEAIYVFDQAGKHRGTISFFPDSLADLLDPTVVQTPPAAVSGERIELRFYHMQLKATLEALHSGESMCIYYESPSDAGLRPCT